MPTLELKPAHKAVAAYYDSLAKFDKLGIKYETAVRSAFQELLEHCARHFDWKLVPEYAIKRKGKDDLIKTENLAHVLKLFRNIFDVAEQLKEVSEKGAELYTNV